MKFTMGDEPDRDRYRFQSGQNLFKVRIEFGDVAGEGANAEALPDHGENHRYDRCDSCCQPGNRLRRASDAGGALKYLLLP